MPLVPICGESLALQRPHAPTPRLCGWLPAGALVPAGPWEQGGLSTWIVVKQPCPSSPPSWPSGGF